MLLWHLWRNGNAVQDQVPVFFLVGGLALGQPEGHQSATIIISSNPVPGSQPNRSKMDLPTDLFALEATAPDTPLQGSFLFYIFGVNLLAPQVDLM